MTYSMVAICTAALAVLAFVCVLDIGASSADDSAVSNVVSVDAVGDDTASIPDFDGDGTIGFGDFVKFAAKFGLAQVDDGYDALYDLNGDGEIGFSDFVLFAQNFGKEVPSEPVTIPDANLRATIEDALGKDGDAPITEAEMATLDSLEANDANISDLTGLEFATKLSYLNLASWSSDDLPDNNITDISALAGLTSLETLRLGDNNVTDISALANLTNLRRLDLQFNRISNISALSGLTELTFLKLGYNNLTLFEEDLRPTPENSGIADISPLSGLTNLTVLELQYNNIADISALSGLTKLGHLILQVNPIEDISALSGLANLYNLIFGANDITDISALSGLTNLRWLILEANSIADLSPLAGLRRIESLDLNRNDITNISPLSGLTGLTRLNLSYNKISDISALTGLTNLTRLELWLNKVKEISPLRGLTNLTELEVRWNPLNDRSLNEHIPALENRGVSVFYTRLGKGDFDIELVFTDDFSEDEKDVLRLVARRWMSVISTDLPDYTFAEGWSGQCGDQSFTIPAGERIDDLRIYMTTFDVDDSPNAVGWGSPRLVREQNHLPVLGCMGFDLERANLLITGLHEIGHVLGFGTTWNDLGFYQNPPEGNEHFNGPLAISAFDDAGGRNYQGAKVPLADPAHWSGDVFGHGELMLPWGGGALSAITIQSLADLGYGVDVTQADPYMLHQHGAAGKAVATIAVATPAIPSLGENDYRLDILMQSSAERYVQGSIEGRKPLGLADGRTSRLVIAEWMWGHGNTFDLAGNVQAWEAGSTALAAPELTCGAGLMDDPIYVVNPQGRIVRTINR